MGAEAKRSVREVPIACGLSDLEQRQRREELSRQLFSGCQRTDELDDGYEFVFPGGAEWAEKLVRFVASERECCPFFGFEMIFESGQGPISLRVRGPEGTKEFVRAEFAGGKYCGERFSPMARVRRLVSQVRLEERAGS